MKKLNKPTIKSPKLAYTGYLLQTFLKRPFGYVVAILYVVYLAVILLIVPAALKLQPLFIWNIGGFNMPMFNLFFIGGMAASIAVAVFRTGRDDGTDLNLSAKPITKGTQVGIKTGVYLLIMFIVCMITVALASLIMPVFGKFNEISNHTGIEPGKYLSLLTSLLVGNIINMLFFGGISVFISMIGGQVITIIGTIAVVFVMCIMNFIYPQVISSPVDVLSNKYDTEILSYSCNTLNQVDNPEIDQNPRNYATIQCLIDTLEQQEVYHYDTNEYWNKAKSESGRQAVNYIDFGRQLSSLYSAFGLDESRLQEASKLVIGTNSSYSYDIDETTHVSDEENILNGNYPIGYYGISYDQDRDVPYVRFLGGNMNLTGDNWYLHSTLNKFDFNSIDIASPTWNNQNTSDEVWEHYNKKPWHKLSDLNNVELPEDLNPDEAYESAVLSFKGFLEDNPDPQHHIDAYAWSIYGVIGKYEIGETPTQIYDVASKLHLIWLIDAINWQKEQIDDFCDDESIDDIYPYKSSTLIRWFAERANFVKSREDNDIYYQNTFNTHLIEWGIPMEFRGTELAGSFTAFSNFITSTVDYAETFDNMYQYTVKSFYRIADIIAIWTVISCCLFTGSIIAYKRTDFK